MDNRVKKLFGAVCVFGFFYLFVYTSLAFGSSSQKDYESNRVVIRVWNTESVSDIAKGAAYSGEFERRFQFYPNSNSGLN